jgi:fibrillarin-like pre-rRNA processing protein
MKPTKIKGIYKEKNKLFTENPKVCNGIKVYNEKIINKKGKQYRSWNPYRSKMAAALQKNLNIPIKKNSKILYLGASSGTTVSHISDIITDGTIYAVESSPISFKKFSKLYHQRKNIIPILEDANHPDRYLPLVPKVDIIYQDISQRNQAEIFISNIKTFLKKDGKAYLMVKARSIDVSSKPKKIYEIVAKQLQKNDIKIKDIVELQPYEKDHACISVFI